MCVKPVLVASVQTWFADFPGCIFRVTRLCSSWRPVAELGMACACALECAWIFLGLGLMVNSSVALERFSRRHASRGDLFPHHCHDSYTESTLHTRTQTSPRTLVSRLELKRHVRCGMSTADPSPTHLRQIHLTPKTFSSSAFPNT